jgi:hypothetical protein
MSAHFIKVDAALPHLESSLITLSADSSPPLQTEYPLLRRWSAGRRM